MIELTIEQAKKNPANFLYVFASDAFLNALNKKHADTIGWKKANEVKVLMLSALKYFGSEDEWKRYTDAIYKQFVADFGITPAEALVRLAQGKTVAGKNWEKGVYGIGAIRPKSFKDTDITVNESNGYMMANNQYLPVFDTIYGENGEVFQQTYYDEKTGRTYISEKSKTGKWFAKSYSESDGNMFNASGKKINSSESGSVWESIELSFDFIQRIIDWIKSVFSANKKEETKTLSSENTLPNQKADGFVYESGIGEAGGILLALVAGGTLLATGALGGKKKKSK